MSSRVIVVAVMVLLASLAISEGTIIILLFTNFLALFFSMHVEVDQQTLLHLVTLCDSFLLTEVSLRGPGVSLHCRCIETESRPIGRYIKSVEIICPNSHCDKTEIM